MTKRASLILLIAGGTVLASPPRASADDDSTRSPELGALPGAFDAPPPSTAPPRPSRLLPALVLGVGAVPLMTGAILQYRMEPPPLGYKQPEHLINAPAIAVSVAGGVAVVAGLYLLWRGERHERERSSLPTATLARDGAVVGWSQSF